MSQLYMMVSILERRMTKRFAAFYESVGLEVSVTTLGMGTAASEVLDYFGLDGAEKGVMFHIVTRDRWKSVKRELRLKMSIDVPGIGIVFILPLSSVGGIKTLNYLTAGQEFEKGDESTLKDTKYELLVVIANQGHTELIMDAAREVHATGGTVIHAKGTGIQQAEKFMGVTLVPEKEMLFIVTKKTQKDEIMSAIMRKAGTGSKAGAIVFSLPVTDTAGMRMIEDLDEEV